MRIFSVLFISSIILSISCQKNRLETRTINDNIVPDSLKLNQIQIFGSHNSYRYKTDQDIYEVLLTLQDALPSSFQIEELDYFHIPMIDQFYDYGIRQIELDIYLDPDGGKFYNRKGNEMAGREKASYVEELKLPGIKVMHIPDIDFNTHYISFKDALREVKVFSDQNPNHIPITILLEMKTETINDYIPNVGFATALPWDLSAFLEMEEEILDIFPIDQIITPDKVRQNASSLKAGVLTNGWPSIGETRGKVMFAFSNSTQQNNIYKTNAPSLETRLCFTNANPNDDDAAFLMYNNPLTHQDEIKHYVEEGFIIRTRTDAGTIEARTGDYSMYNAAINSGAQFLSTDYYKADYRGTKNLEFTSYSVSFENRLYQRNPVAN